MTVEEARQRIFETTEQRAEVEAFEDRMLRERMLKLALETAGVQVSITQAVEASARMFRFVKTGE